MELHVLTDRQRRCLANFAKLDGVEELTRAIVEVYVDENSKVNPEKKPQRRRRRRKPSPE